MAAAIHVQSLSKTYQKRKAAPVRAVDNISFEVPTGQVLGFLGPNGAGKTTTIKMVCGLVLPDTGSVQLNGRDVIRQRGAAMRQIGAVLEGARNVYWRLTAWQNLIYFGRLKGVGRGTIRPRAERLLHELDLWDRRNDPVGEFSRGMQQKVAIACALIADPPIVLLDEPTLGLDVQAARTVKEWVQRLAREEGKTVVLTTHQLDMAQQLCDHVNIMHRGKLVADQSLGDLLSFYRQENYEVRVDGDHTTYFNGQRPPALLNVQIQQENGVTVLRGGIFDQTRLHDVLSCLHAAKLPLISVTRLEPDLEQVFVHLIEGSASGPDSSSPPTGHTSDGARP